jgi:hypothetical protein
LSFVSMTTPKILANCFGFTSSPSIVNGVLLRKMVLGAITRGNWYNTIQYNLLRPAAYSGRKGTSH